MAKNLESQIEEDIAGVDHFIATQLAMIESINKSMDELFGLVPEDANNS